MYFRTSKDLSLEEFGVMATMIGLPTADYVTAEELTNFSTDGIDTINNILESLVAKGYVLKLSDRYAVNKEVIPQLAKGGDL